MHQGDDMADLKKISLAEACDLIEVSTITSQKDYPGCVRLHMTHPERGEIITLQAGEDVFLIGD